MVIAERARRTDGHLDGIKPGQCHLGSHKSYKMTEKEYRYAKKILVDNGLIKIIVTNRTKKIGAKNREIKICDFGATSGATSLTTTGTIVELCNSEVWDINLECSNQQKGDLKGELGATSGRQTRKNKKEKEKTNQPNLPSSDSVSGLGRSVGSQEIEEIRKWLMNAKFKEAGSSPESFSEFDANFLIDTYGAERILEVKTMMSKKHKNAFEKIKSQKGYFKSALIMGWK